MNSTGDDGAPQALLPVPRPARVRELRRLLTADGSSLVLGAADALTARLVEQAGFAICYATGAGAANLGWALPDVGLLGMGEVAQYVQRMTAAVRIPVIVDADDGYGGPLSVMRTVTALEAAGAAGIQIEDQAAPKRCGHFDRKRLVPPDEMAAKLLAAGRARTDDTVLVARSDAIAVEGFEAAVQRGRLYASAGADALFIEAPENLEQLRRLPRLLPSVPLVANVVPGGRTPVLSLAELQGFGYQLVLHAALVMRVSLQAARHALEELAGSGDSRTLAPVTMSWQDRQALVELAQFDALEDALHSAARDLLPGGSPSGEPILDIGPTIAT